MLDRVSSRALVKRLCKIMFCNTSKAERVLVLAFSCINRHHRLVGLFNTDLQHQYFCLVCYKGMLRCLVCKKQGYQYQSRKQVFHKTFFSCSFKICVDVAFGLRMLRFATLVF